MSDIDWEDLFGISDHDNDDSNSEQHADNAYSIPGLKLEKNALTHEQQMRLVYAIAEADYFQGGKLDQAMCFGDLGPFEWVESWIRNEYPNLIPSRILKRACLFDQAIINLYHKGQGIKSHVDLMRFDDGIVIISLLSSCVMVMKPVDSETLQQRGTIPILLRPGDVLALSGPARYDWEHGIEERMTDDVNGEWIERGTRISVTLRKLLVK